MLRTFRILSPLTLVLLAGAVAHAKDLPNHDASYEQPAALHVLSSPRPRHPLSAFVASTDPRTGAPSFVWGSQRTAAAGVTPDMPPSAAARLHLAAHAELYGLSKAALDTAKVAQVHDTGRGAIVVIFRQEIDGVPVFAHEAKVLMRRDRSLVAISDGLHPLSLKVMKGSKPSSLPPAGAVARALSDLYSLTVPSSVLVPVTPAKKAGSTAPSTGKDLRFDMSPAGGLTGIRFETPARAREVLFPIGGVLVPAHHVEVFSFEQGAEVDAYGYVIAADDGRVLRRQNLTAHAAFKYRVFADEGGDHRPLDGPIADFTPHPTGVPDGSYPEFVAPVLVTMEGFNKNKDPWLAEGATQSRGNNVDAYTDHDDSNNVNGGDVRATTTAPGEFDRVYDTSKEPHESEDQKMAAVTQLFYVTNWLHDYWYDSGFDEAAGNAQFDNYGRGGEDNDPLRCEAQDAYLQGARNNANMATPKDGISPRMQMYVWDGKEERSLTIAPTGQTPNTNVADFGQKSYDIEAEVALVDDGQSPKTNACEPLVGDVAGKIALVDRGQCTFHQKAVNVEAAGAVGMLLVNSGGGQPPFMPPVAELPPVGIPVMSISQGQGSQIKSALAEGPVTAAMHRVASPATDGTIDNLIVAHEWGHYIHHRLVSCGLNQCGGESEGWGDFIALTMQIRETDDLDGVFSDALYATAAMDDAAYFGTRRVPYSVDWTKNSLTFKHIEQGVPLPGDIELADGPNNNAEVHNAGEVWATMLFEGYVAMLKRSKATDAPYSFDEARRRFADYVVAGMKLAPVEPTFTEQRDAIVAAAYASDPADGLLVAEGFARRGAGSCAESPAKTSFDNDGVVESFVVAPAVRITEVLLDDTAASCDADGLLDAGETGTITVSLANRGFLPAPGTKVKVVSTTPGVTFPNGAEVTVDLDGFVETKVTIDVAIGETQKAPGFLAITAVAENPAACNPSVLSQSMPRVNYDNAPQTSAVDDFESDLSVWTLEGDGSEEIWSEVTDEKGNHVWHGVDYSSLSDTSLVSPPLQVSDTGPFVLSFKHRHKFETSPQNPNDPDSPVITWDGSVVEVSLDGGSTWDDIRMYGDPGYNGTIGDLADNPLSNREGYTDENPSWPEMDAVSIDVGSAFAGKTVVVRFRIGSDQAASDVGWQIDDVGFQGIVGTPFPTVTNDAQSCAPDRAPVANAGPDQEVEGGAKVTLDASESSDPDGDELSFAWSQLEGPSVAITADGPKATLIAPDVDEETALTFAVKVTANGQSSDDFVTVLVSPAGEGDGLEGGGCGCAVPGEERSPAAPLGVAGALLAGLALVRRRRRTG